ncbi:MAG: N-formylglutamate amidohydrolase [Pseudomonadales bacterium]|nr:N-formylglutamate amidohydrolase [Pseudomonadales bacterium]
MARALSDSLDAALVAQRYSRLLYDCNRPPNEPSAIPQLSEETEIKGNAGLSVEAREYRVERIYEPFHDAISAQIAARKAAGRNTIVVSIHSFTPIYLGRQRAVQLGIISDTDNPFADAFYQQARKNKAYDIRINEPYGPSDPVLHLVTRHAEEHQLASIMLEIRNDLLLTAEGVTQWARLIADTLNSFKN